jgi:hypothetical protein
VNPDVTEEAVKTTRSFFEALREQPLSLALVVMNFALLGYLFWSGKETLGMAYKSQVDTQLLLDKCFDRTGKT